MINHLTCYLDLFARTFLAAPLVVLLLVLIISDWLMGFELNLYTKLFLIIVNEISATEFCRKSGYFESMDVAFIDNGQIYFCLSIILWCAIIYHIGRLAYTRGVCVRVEKHKSS